MTPDKLEQIYSFFTEFWSAETSHIPAEWLTSTPSMGQAVPTTLLLHDLLGGEIQSAKIHLRNGHIEPHYWNVVNGQNLDITRRQYGVSITSITPHPVPVGFTSYRGYILKSPSTQKRYELLKNSLSIKDLERFFTLIKS